MKEITGNIWDWVGKAWIVITTNTQTHNKGGKAVMGKGIALQAAQRFPYLPHAYGAFLANNQHTTTPFLTPNDYLICLPTKIDWRNRSPLWLIEQQITWLKNFSTQMNPLPIVTPRLGCGLGGLSWEEQVKPLMITLPDNVWVIIPQKRT